MLSNRLVMQQVLKIREWPPKPMPSSRCRMKWILVCLGVSARFLHGFCKYQYNIKQAGTLRSELEKSDVIYDIADKAVMIVGLLTGDLGLRKRMNTKLKGATNYEDIHTKIS